MARKILLADDSVTAQNMGRKILADAGYEVFTVNNGSAALKKIAETKPDLIVLDVYMPGYSGLEVCQRLKETGETSRIPIVLTVGKLEPFKPEEARRVRADGFIVKPFEASELLSALSKLEDKIVPRPETSKPGRFARLNAALDDGRYDKTVAAEEDQGWKNRLAFPSKKKKAAEPENGDDPAIYNPVNKDLRTVVEHKPEKPPVADEPRVDLGALAPEGLPKDVTPEEIAALAAAAAQVKGKMTESSPAEESKPAAIPEPTAVPVNSGAEAVATKPEAQPETKADERPAIEPPKAVAEVAAHEPKQEEPKQPESKQDEKSETPASVPSSPVADTFGVALSAVECAPAISTAEPVAVASASSDSGNRPASPVEEPATMAVAAGAEYAPVHSRWTATAVALPPEEAAISLELEMQKAQAAFAAADSAVLASIATTVPEPPSAAAVVAIPEPPLEAKPFEVAATPTAPLEAEPAATTSSVAPDPIADAVKDLEAVAASFVELQRATQVSAPAEPESALAAEATPEAPVVATTKAEDAPVASSESKEPEALRAESTSEVVQPTFVDHEQPSLVAEAKLTNDPAPPADSSASTDADPSALPEAVGIAEDRPVASEFSTTDSQEQQPGLAPAQEPATPAASYRPHGRESTDKESDIAETTAAAWATWRRIRESGDTSPAPSPKSGDRDSDAAAMAVAAGAESAPEEVAPQESGDIAHIVDSVLADLRPKIVAEISKKLGKKK